MNGSYKMFQCDLIDILIGPKWNEWINGLDNYLKLVNIVDDSLKKATLLYYAGDEVLKIYKKISEGKNRNLDSYEEMKEKLSNHFSPKRNIYYKKHIFRQVKQEDGESIASYVIRLKNLSKYFDFKDADEEIITQFVEGCNDKEMIGKIFKAKDGLKLDEVLEWERNRKMVNHLTLLKKAQFGFTLNKVSS